MVTVLRHQRALEGVCAQLCTILVLTFVLERLSRSVDGVSSRRSQRSSPTPVNDSSASLMMTGAARVFERWMIDRTTSSASLSFHQCDVIVLN